MSEPWPYICFFCHKEFRSFEGARQHTEVVHGSYGRTQENFRNKSSQRWTDNDLTKAKTGTYLAGVKP